jgi:hypothetical protein
MTVTAQGPSLEDKIDLWREYLRRRQAIQAVDVAELEDHLREQVATLTGAGLDTDEAFLVAVKRIGALDAVSREYAIEHSERLWKQLVVPAETLESRARVSKEALVAVLLAVAAGLATKVPALFGVSLDHNPGEYMRNAGLYVLPFLTAYFAWKRGMSTAVIRWLALAFVAAAVFANVYPFPENSHTETLTGLHLLIALWLAVGIAYAGARWGQVSGRMDFIRYSGELFIYYVLIALGGGVLMLFMTLIFQAIGVDVMPFFQSWLLAPGAAGAVLIASWLVESKQSVIENMAPVLTRLFSPLFAAVLVAFVIALVWTGRGVAVQRETLIAFDFLLVLVLGLLLYAISARDPNAPAGAFDVLQVVLVIAALLANAAALWAIASRISEFGFSPNKVAALGENVILLVNLGWSAVLYIRLLRGRGTFAALEKWQTDYLPVYAAWAAIVVIVFPPLFGYS